jgi:hypothetical protein
MFDQEIAASQVKADRFPFRTRGISRWQFAKKITRGDR